MKQYIVDAFTDSIFSGNPAAVCVVDNFLDDGTMQNIAVENNLSETAFVRKSDFYIRWFTPGGEIDFCGHATLASAFVLFNFYSDENTKIITFNSQVGHLTALKHDDLIEMDYPAYNLNPIEVTDEMEDILGESICEAYLDRDLLLVLDSEESVYNANPNFDRLVELDGLCIAITAKSNKFDCISRVFGPKIGIDEDPVTGSTHCMIIPYWSKKLNKSKIHAFQASKRTGIIIGKNDGDRIKISGNAALFSISKIFL